MAEKKLYVRSKKTPKRKRKIYLGITTVMILLLAIAAISILHSSLERRTTEYIRRARESYDIGDYENALLYLRRVKEDEETAEVLLLMADCYEAMENYPRALETLRKLNTAEPAVANRIQAIEQRKLQQTLAKQITIAGVELDSNAQSATLDNLNLTDEELQELAGLYTLDRLSVRNNLISDISALSQLKGLDELDLSGNQVRNISPLSELGSLRELNLDGNPVENCDALRALRYLNRLSVVDTGMNETVIRELADDLPGCSIQFGTKGSERILITGEIFDLSTTELTLSQKGLSDIGMLQGFTELKVLNLSENDISDIRPLMELSKLESLNIDENSVSDLRPLIGLPNLIKLEAADNQISETTSTGSIERLTELDLSGNPIRDFSGLGRLGFLKILDLRETSIADSDLRELYGLRSIYSIDLRNNSGLSDIAIGALKSALPGCIIATSELIYEIDLSGHLVRSDEKSLVFPSGGITDLNGISRMTCLEELNLRDNGIVSLYPFEVTASKASIRKLNLADNQIRDVLSLYALSSIEELDLSGNQIQTVASLRKLTTLKKLNLSGNPVSEEEVSNLREWLPGCEIYF